MISEPLKAARAKHLRDLREEVEDYEHKLLNEAAENDELPEGAMFHTIGTFWDCPKSPFGLCAYDFMDRAKDHCVFCHQPAERK